MTKREPGLSTAAAPALLAALLFGASTPFAKLLVSEMHPLLLAGVMYLGSGLGLCVVLLLRGLTTNHRAGSAAPQPGIAAKDLPWLLGAIAAGGVLGPVLLMTGLIQTDAASASLLLNVEGVLTAVIAWVVFKENADRQIVLGMLAIVAGGFLLSWQPSGARFSAGSLLVLCACLCWAIDNNLTRKVSANDAMLLACIKGLVAGLVNTGLALGGSSAALAAWPVLGAALLVGFVGYGLSLALFVIALRLLGAARTGAYFSVAPLFGVVIALAIWPQLPGPMFWVAAVLMALGVWLHLREHHAHPHRHVAEQHSHRHRHDAHHQHEHDFPWDGKEPHTHAHAHSGLTHAHRHFPDIHHRHRH